MVKSRKQIESRVRVVHWGILVGFSILACRLGYLQIIKYPQFKAYAAKQQLKPIKIAAKRGVITDRKGRKLAIDIKSYSIYIDPLYFKASAEETAKQLSPILELDETEMTQTLKTKYWRYIKRKVNEETAKQIKELKIKGIGMLSESKRVYPHNQLAASLIGFTDIDNYGQEGIEKAFDQYLKGGSTSIDIVKDAYGNQLLRKNSDLPLLTEKAKANKIVLTIDEDLQYLAERELHKAIKKTRSDRGTVIIMDVKNGDLLSLATYPTYDPNKLNERKKYSQVKNWAVTDFYEPGSTMKVFTIAAALEENKLSVNETIACPGMIKIGKWKVHDHHVPAKKIRYLTPANIIEVSSNVGSSIIGRRLDPDTHRKYLKKFGFGRKTESELIGEVSGILPSNAKQKWNAVRQSTISFGQGIAVTPIQIVTAFSAIANQGIRVEPRILKQVLSPEGLILKELPPKTSRTMSENTAKEVLNMMVSVVDGKKGTARDAKIPGYVLGGKTGTADKVNDSGRGYSREVMASFGGFLPADNPKFIIFVLLDSPRSDHFATLTAVPVFKSIAEQMITYYDLQPTRHSELEKNILLRIDENHEMKLNPQAR